MKRDMDLVRRILLELEGHQEGYAPSELQIQGYSQEQIGFHVLLMGEAGLLVAHDGTCFGSTSPMGIASRLTWEGYEFLDAARSDSIWTKAKQQMRDEGLGMTWGVLKDLLIALAKRSVGLP